jgi:hypothetical protein
MYDIVIPVGPNDSFLLVKQLEYTQTNCIGYRNIYIVASTQVESFVPSSCIFIDEGIFPFKLTDLHTFANSDASQRNGWYFQQLIKLYAGSIIPDILPRWLVIDADTFFLRPTSFIRDNKCLYANGTEYWPYYFDHMNRLIPGLNKVEPISGICHHMMFEQRFVKELMNLVEQNGDPFWITFLSKVGSEHKYGEYGAAGASEYELYFNYMLTFHRDEITLRPLKWRNVETLDLSLEYDYISYHHHSRKD